MKSATIESTLATLIETANRHHDDLIERAITESLVITHENAYRHLQETVLVSGTATLYPKLYRSLPAEAQQKVDIYWTELAISAADHVYVKLRDIQEAREQQLALEAATPTQLTLFETEIK